jgi:hypothetical protein
MSLFAQAPQQIQQLMMHEHPHEFLPWICGAIALNFVYTTVVAFYKPKITVDDIIKKINNLQLKK